MPRSLPLARPVVLGLALLGLAAATAPALAADSAVTVSGSGTVSMTQPTVSNFGGVSASLSAVTTTAAVGGFTVTDTTVPATGWRVQVSATRFCTGSTRGTVSDCPAGSIGLPAGRLSHGVPASVTGGGGTVPTLAAASAVDGSTGSLLVSAPTTTSGTWLVGGSTLTLSVPASATPGTYTSAVTYTVSQGP